MLARNTIIQGDALALLPCVEDSSIDLIICDGPYGVTTNPWDRVGSIQKYNLNLIKMFSTKLKDGGALYLFGKHDAIDFIDYRSYLTLRSKIVWYQPSRLAQGRSSFTNNYDIICYFIKGYQQVGNGYLHKNNKAKTFNLESIRVPQLVELEHRLRCEKVPSVTNGKYNKTKFNDKGKNPGDVWGDIKQLTYKSKELVSRETLNTIQKPEKLLERIILASSNKGDLVLDPFCGVGTTAVVCKKLGRNFICMEQNSQYVKWGNERVAREHANEFKQTQQGLFSDD